MNKILSFVFLGVICCLIAACQNDNGEAEVAVTEEEAPSNDTLPIMVTTDVSMLVSDSGVLKYHAIAPIWYRYTVERNEDFWYFPQGIELRQLDEDLQPAGNILADTAYHYERSQLWRLVGNVRIANTSGERFNTEELYWDGRKQTVYSDSFIHIERQKDILEGYGFTSDQTFSKYEIRKTTGIFEMRNENYYNDYGPDDDGEHLAENDEPGTISPTDTIEVRPLTPQEKAEAARRRRNHNPEPLKFRFEQPQ